MIFRIHLAQPNLFLQLKVVGLLNTVHECNRPSLQYFLFSVPPLPAAVVIVVVGGSCPLTILNCTYFLKKHFQNTMIFRIHLAQPNLLLQLKVAGLLNSVHECAPPSLLDFLFSVPPLLAAIVIVVVGGSRPLTILNCTYFSEKRFSLYNDTSNPSRSA